MIDKILNSFLQKGIVYFIPENNVIFPYGQNTLIKPDYNINCVSVSAIQGLSSGQYLVEFVLDFTKLPNYQEGKNYKAKLVGDATSIFKTIDETSGFISAITENFFDFNKEILIGFYDENEQFVGGAKCFLEEKNIFMVIPYSLVFNEYGEVKLKLNLETSLTIQLKELKVQLKTFEGALDTYYAELKLFKIELEKLEQEEEAEEWKIKAIEDAIKTTENSIETTNNSIEIIKDSIKKKEKEIEDMSYNSVKFLTFYLSDNVKLQLNGRMANLAQFGAVEEGDDIPTITGIKAEYEDWTEIIDLYLQHGLETNYAQRVKSLSNENSGFQYNYPLGGLYVSNDNYLAEISIPQIQFDNNFAFTKNYKKTLPIPTEENYYIPVNAIEIDSTIGNELEILL